MMNVRILIALILFIPLTISCSRVVGIEDFSLEEKARKKISELSDQQKEITRHNATLLAFREQFKQDSTFIDISEERISFYNDALSIILTSEAGEKLDVIQELKVFDYRNLNEILVYPFSTAPFLEAWNDSSIETGIQELDTILIGKGFGIEQINHWSFRNNEPTFLLRTETALNTLQISDLMRQTGHFENVGINAWFGDGSNIEAKNMGTHYRFTFISAYGDCPAGCINEDRYTFTLSETGEVSYVE